jgi:biotin carboxylase
MPIVYRHWYLTREEDQCQNRNKLLLLPSLTSFAATHCTGYGFLSESAPFAQSLLSSNIEWVGPPPSVLELFGDKIQARALAQESGVPVVRGSGNLKSGEECLEILERGDFGLPAIMKVGWSFFCRYNTVCT